MGIGVAITNHKGGVGKTALVVNTADGIAREDQKVLVMDLDPQANTTKNIRGREVPAPTLSMADALLHPDDDVTQFIQTETGIKGVHLLPSSIKLMRIEEPLKARSIVPAKTFNAKMDHLKSIYDVILIDTPPNLFLLPTIALCCADYYFVPLLAGDVGSLDGIDDLLDLVRQVKELNPGLKLGGAIINGYDGRKRMHRATRNAAELTFGSHVLKAHLCETTAVQKAAAKATTVMALDRALQPSQDIAAISREMLGIMGVTLKHGAK